MSVKFFASIFDFEIAFIIIKNGITFMFYHVLMEFDEKISKIAEVPNAREMLQMQCNFLRNHREPENIDFPKIYGIFLRYFLFSSIAWNVYVGK